MCKLWEHSREMQLIFNHFIVYCAHLWLHLQINNKSPWWSIHTFHIYLSLLPCSRQDLLKATTFLAALNGRRVKHGKNNWARCCRLMHDCTGPLTRTPLTTNAPLASILILSRCRATVHTYVGELARYSFAEMRCTTTTLLALSTTRRAHNNYPRQLLRLSGERYIS